MSTLNISTWKEEGTLSLTTYYKNGKGVATPLGYAKKGNKLFVNTLENSFKIKRIKNNPSGKVAVCNMRGTLKGPLMDVTVRFLRLGEDEEAKVAMKYDSKFV